MDSHPAASSLRIFFIKPRNQLLNQLHHFERIFFRLDHPASSRQSSFEGEPSVGRFLSRTCLESDIGRA